MADVIPFPISIDDETAAHVATISRSGLGHIVVSFDAKVEEMILTPEDAERLAIALLRA